MTESRPADVRKDALKLDLWLGEPAPSSEVRKWFGHDPRRWDEFKRRYHSELRRPERPALLHELLALARKGPVTLLYGARDEEHNEAVAPREFLEALPRSSSASVGGFLEKAVSGAGVRS